ncbi:MAG TPA: DUF262 domain-containing protein [Thermoanaerobaculia bacterium]|nr:DUF262 domain-containing protein [Thermoanaerobaculia bacterium]
MPTQRYSVTQPHIETLFAWIQSGEIAIPEIQRPFVWDAVKVRNFLDSLFQGFPVGYLIAWRNPDVRLKDGRSSSGRRILIDGQQRVTALMAAILGREVVNKEYRHVRIRIGFHPIERKFEVHNPAIAQDAQWIPDIAEVFDPSTSFFDLVNTYCAKNPGTTQQEIFKSLEALKGITSNQIGLIELAGELDIETVTEIFIRVNSAGVPLGQADFAMSKIAVNETYGGHTLRKAIDYFCHMAVVPDFYRVAAEDAEFADSSFLQTMSWLRHENDNLYDPSYSDLLRVAFTSEFRRGRLQDLVALLSGRNFETKQHEEAIVEDSFRRLDQSVRRFMNETNFKQLLMIIRSAGFVDASLIGSQNALNFAYILYLTLRQQGLHAGEIERIVRRWYVYSMLTGAYSGNAEGNFDYDIRQIQAHGAAQYTATLIQGRLSDGFWQASLPQAMDTSSSSSPYLRLFKAAQVKMKDTGFLSRDITVADLIVLKGDDHHLFPRKLLKDHGLTKGQYNQIANFVVAQSEINIAIGAKSPQDYMKKVLHQCEGGKKHYGNITDPDQLRDNLRAHCIPEGFESMKAEDYPAFLVARRQLIALKIKEWFETL